MLLALCQEEHLVQNPRGSNMWSYPLCQPLVTMEQLKVTCIELDMEEDRKAGMTHSKWVTYSIW